MADSCISHPQTCGSEWKVGFDIEPAAGPDDLFSRGASNKYHRSSVSLMSLHLPAENLYPLFSVMNPTTIFDGLLVLFFSSFVIFYLKISNSVDVLRARTNIKKKNIKDFEEDKLVQLWQRKKF